MSAQERRRGRVPASSHLSCTRTNSSRLYPSRTLLSPPVMQPTEINFTLTSATFVNFTSTSVALVNFTLTFLQLQQLCDNFTSISTTSLQLQQLKINFGKFKVTCKNFKVTLFGCVQQLQGVITPSASIEPASRAARLPGPEQQTTRRDDASLRKKGTFEGDFLTKRCVAPHLAVWTEEKRSCSITNMS